MAWGLVDHCVNVLCFKTLLPVWIVTELHYSPSLTLKDIWLEAHAVSFATIWHFICFDVRERQCLVHRIWFGYRHTTVPVQTHVESILRWASSCCTRYCNWPPSTRTTLFNSISKRVNFYFQFNYMNLLSVNIVLGSISEFETSMYSLMWKCIGPILSNYGIEMLSLLTCITNFLLLFLFILFLLLIIIGKYVRSLRDCLNFHWIHMHRQDYAWGTSTS